MTTVDLRTEFSNLQPRLARLQGVMKEQIIHLVDESGLTLGVPIESRLKTWDSFDEKLKRKGLLPKSLTEIEDLLGLRLIFLFQKDLDQFVAQFEKVFVVHSREDTSTRLSASEFGYKSQHFIVSVPSTWGAPTMSGLRELKVEVQIRTLSQHIWASASHKLQYKREDGVPEPIKRTINRVSALLELVDLELDKVLRERQSYVEAQITRSTSSADPLDVSVIEAVLDAELPPANKDIFGESYGELLPDLLKQSIQTRGQLQELLRSQLIPVLAVDAHNAANIYYDDESEEGEKLESRQARGVYFTHAGLVREALIQKFGEIARKWQ